MSKSTTVIPQIKKKKPGPKATGKGTQIQVRLQPDLLILLDNNLQSGESRPEAIRRLINEALALHKKN